MIRLDGRTERCSSYFCACALLDTTGSPFLLIALVRMFAIFIRQMRVGLHGGDHTSVPQPLLHKLPVYWFTILQVGANEGCCMRVPQNVWMQDHSRFPGVILEDLLHGSDVERGPVGWLPVTALGA